MHDDGSAPQVPIDTRASRLRPCARFTHPSTGITLEIASTEPAFQFYTGEGISNPAVDGCPERGPRAGFAFEPARYIDAANNPDWKPMVLLRKGQKFGSRIVYRAWKQS